MPTTFGADKPTMTLGADGSGVVTAALHYLDGSVVSLPPITLLPHQVTEALRVIPQAAQVLSGQLTAHGGAQPDDIAGFVALVQYILTTPAASSGSGVTTVTTAPSLLF